MLQTNHNHNYRIIHFFLFGSFLAQQCVIQYLLSTDVVKYFHINRLYRAQNKAKKKNVVWSHSLFLMRMISFGVQMNLVGLSTYDFFFSIAMSIHLRNAINLHKIITWILVIKFDSSSIVPSNLSHLTFQTWNLKNLSRTFQIIILN